MVARALTFLLTLLFAAPFPATAQGDIPRLADEVSRSIRTYPRLTIFDDVSGRLEGGTVLLSGKVTLAQKRDELEQRIRSVPGVDAVRNEIQVLPASGSDDALRRRVARAIYGSAGFWRYAALPRPPIHILVEHGHVTLTGIVASDSERALAHSLASGHGERSVTNALRTDVAAR